MSKLAYWGGARSCWASFKGWPIWSEADKVSVNRLIESGGWGQLRGTEVEAFSRELGDFLGAKYVVPCSSGTSALETQLKAVGVSAGDEVIVPSYTCFATATPILNLRAFPVIVDVDPETYTMDPEKAAAAISVRTKAIVPVHLYSGMADLDQICTIGADNAIPIIEDAAQATGSKWRQVSAGLHGISGSFSFQESKTLTAGEGGAIITDDVAMFEFCKEYVNCGRPSESSKSHAAVFGTNFRMSGIQAALLRSQLEQFRTQIEIRQNNARVLDAGLNAIPGISALAHFPKRQTTRTFYKYVFRLQEEILEQVTRAQFIAALEAEGVPCRSLFVPLNRDPLLPFEVIDWLPTTGLGSAKWYRSLNFPVAERAAYKEAVGLWHPLLLGSESDIQSIIEAVGKVSENLAEVKMIGQEL